MINMEMTVLDNGFMHRVVVNEPMWRVNLSSLIIQIDSIVSFI